MTQSILGIYRRKIKAYGYTKKLYTHDYSNIICREGRAGGGDKKSQCDNFLHEAFFF